MIQVLPVVLEKKIFKDFSIFACMMQISAWIGILWTFEGDLLRNIQAKFDQISITGFGEEDVFVNCWRHTPPDTAPSQKLTLVLCARWAKNNK